MLFLCLIFILSNKIILGQYSSTFIGSYGNYSKKANVLFSKKDGAEETLSRREILTLTVGGIAYTKVAASALTKINRGDAYPEEHENRVSDAFERSIIEAYLSSDRDVNTPLRILEIGIGTSCRTVVRGLYDKALTKLALFSEKTTKPGIEFIGLDVDATPTKAFETARMKLMTSFPNLSISFDVIQGDIVGGLVFPDGYFGEFAENLNPVSPHVIFQTVMRNSQYFSFF
jgi:hypothetical protein